MSLIKIFIFISISFNAIGSELYEYCSDDPTGEIYSEVWDSPSIEDSFSTIGLNASNYKELIESNKDDSLFTLSVKAEKKYPEISKALHVWMLETCITRGYNMLNGIE